MRRQLDEALLGEQAALSGLKKRLLGRFAELDVKEDRLLDLLGDADWPKAEIKSKLAEIAGERREIDEQLADTSSKLDVGREFSGAPLRLLADPQGFYGRGGGAVKRGVIKVVFEKLHLDAEPGAQGVVGATAWHRASLGLSRLGHMPMPGSRSNSPETPKAAPSRWRKPPSSGLPMRSYLRLSSRTRVQVGPQWWS
ncbi:hypothetical protein AB0H12_08760 [Actinosynnema sp. NPDC023794]